MTKKPLMLLCGVAVLATLCSVSAMASTVQFAFSFTGPVDSGSGIFTADTTATPGQYLITGISGSVDGLSITSLLPVNTYPPDFVPANDNLLFVPGAPFDVGGVSFELSDGSDINIFTGGFIGGDGTDFGNLLIGGPSDQAAELLTTFDVVPVPEPGSLALLGTGALGLIGVVRRRVAA